MTVEQKAEEWVETKGTDAMTCLKENIGWDDVCKQAFIDGYHECKKEHEGKYKTAYIKGIRTMANALKDYDRTNGAWTNYFEHTVEEVLNKLLKDQ